MLLFKSFIRKIDRFAFNYSSENINLEILWSRMINNFNVIFEQHIEVSNLTMIQVISFNKIYKIFVIREYLD